MALIQGCAKSEPDSNTNKSTVFKLNKLDIVGAKALAIAGSQKQSVQVQNSRSTEEGAGLLFKVDDEGNLNVVNVEVLELEDGSTKTVRKDYTIEPNAVFPIGDRYLYLDGCYLFDASGQSLDITSYYEEGNSYNFYRSFSILVNKNTGKIYYIPQAALRYFPSLASIFNGDMSFYNNNIVIADDGTFYMNALNGVVKVVVNDDNASISTFGPQYEDDPEYNHWLEGNSLIPLTNGSVITINHGKGPGWPVGSQIIKILYQNGGFETFDGSNDEWYHGFGDIKDEYTCCYYNGRILAIHRPASNFISHWDYPEDRWGYEKRYDNEDVEINIVEISIGSSYGNITIGKPFFTLKGKNYVWQDYTRPEATDWTEYARDMGGNQNLYVLGDYYMIGNVLAINRNTLQYRDLVKEGISEYVIIPDSKNVYNGKSWKVYTNGSDWFNPTDLTYGSVRWDCPNHFEKCEFDVPNGTITIIYLNPVDGSKRMRTINIETGEYTDTDVKTTQKIIQLIPMN